MASDRCLNVRLLQSSREAKVLQIEHGNRQGSCPFSSFSIFAGSRVYIQIHCILQNRLLH